MGKELSGEEEQVRVLRDLKEGDMVESGLLFPRMSTEPLAWVVMEIREGENASRIVKMHVYFFGVFCKVATAEVLKNDTVTWKVA